MNFERERATPIANPTTAQLARELKKLRSHGRSSFASLTCHDGSYVQAAGGGAGCMVEWRESSTNKHSRAYVEKPTVPFDDGTVLSFGGGRIPLRRDEWLSIGLVTGVFAAFLADQAFPSSIRWRDISDILRVSGETVRLPTG